MRVFGCDAYKQVPKGSRIKFDPKGEKMILVGYEGESENYRLWDSMRHRIHISCDVIFNETSEKSEEISEESGKEAVGRLEFGNYNFFEDEEEAEPPRQADEDQPEDQLANQPEDQPEDQPEEISEQRTNHVPEGRSLRDRSKLRSPDRYSERGYAFVVDSLPLTYEDAVAGDEAGKWQQAMCEEMNALKQNKTWILEKPPDKQKIIGCK